MMPRTTPTMKPSMATSQELLISATSIVSFPRRVSFQRRGSPLNVTPSPTFSRHEASTQTVVHTTEPSSLTNSKSHCLTIMPVFSREPIFLRSVLVPESFSQPDPARCNQTVLGGHLLVRLVSCGYFLHSGVPEVR